MKKFLKQKSINIADWYNDVVVKSELADYAPVRGCMVIRPYGYALWETVQKFMDPLIKEKGVKNAYFPIFIPERFLKKEKEHVEGFSPQMAVVTYAGGEELKEKLVVRPTSETIMYEMYKQWVHSWRDLPVLINQWNNVVRWEKRTYLFLRTTEFLWQEGHCAFETDEENQAFVLWALEMYQKTYQELLGIYGIAGIKSESEKFAGAAKTYTYEILMPDGKVLQGCTSHNLGQNFSKPFDWEVAGKKGEKIYPYQDSWGLSTRSIGGMVLVHGDDNGLILPPNIAPIQVVVIPVPHPSEKIKEYVKTVIKGLGEVRVEFDDREEETAGYKFNEWELKGVPLRLEIGDKEIRDKTVTVCRRDTAEKYQFSITNFQKEIVRLLGEMQKNLLVKHKKFTEEKTHIVDSYDEFRKIMEGQRGFLSAFWCENPDCETKIKEETKASVRCLPLEAKEEEGKCLYCGRPALHRWLFAQSY